MTLNHGCGRVRTAEHAPRGPFRVLERRYGLAEMVERRAGVQVERRPCEFPHPEREFLTLAENACARVLICVTAVTWLL